MEVWFPLLLQEIKAQTVSEVSQEGVGPSTKITVANQGSFEHMTTLNVTGFPDGVTPANSGGPPPAGGMGPSGVMEKKAIIDCLQYDLVVFTLNPKIVHDLANKMRGGHNAPGDGHSSGGTTRRDLRGFLGICQQSAKARGGIAFRVSSRRFEALGSPTVLYGFHVRYLISSIRELTALQGVSKVRGGDK